MERRPGVFIERWDNIDYYKVKYLLKFPRFPNMPSYGGYFPTFAEPSNWGDNFGSRIRAFFVPKQSGLHKFYIGEFSETILSVILGFRAIKNENRALIVNIKSRDYCT